MEIWLVFKMRLTDYLYLYTRSFKHKKNYFYTIVMIICTILVLGTLTFYTNLVNYVNFEITKSLGYRTLIVPGNPELEDNGYKNLKAIAHVKEVYYSRYGSVTSGISSFKNNVLDGRIGLLYGTNNTMPKVILGKSFSNDETGFAICPINFYPDGSIYNFGINEKNIINGEKILNKEFKVMYVNEDSKKELNKTFKVVGLYDNKSVMHFNNECFISAKDITSIVDFTYPITEGTIDSFLVVVDDLDNVKTVNDAAKEALAVSVDFQTQYEMDFTTVKFLLNFCKVLVCLIIFVVFSLMFLYLKKKLFAENKKIGVMRTLGYESKTVANIYFIEIVINNIISFTIGLLIFIVLLVIIVKTILVGVINYGMDIKINPLIILFSALIIIIPTFITKYIINKKCKNDIINIIGNEK